MSVVEFPAPRAASLNYHKLIENGFTPKQIHQIIGDMSEEEAAVLYYDYGFWAREDQQPPNWPWRTWILKGGRGSGKTWVGSNLTIQKSKTVHRLALVGRTTADVRDTMIDGESGILALSPPWWMPKYEPAKRRLVWPNGSFAILYSAEEPSLLRGPAFGFAWADELASWRKLKESWDNLMLCLRSGNNPQVVVTTTPRPIPLIKELIARETSYVTTASTYANRNNLAVAWAEEIISVYEGTRLGRQEIFGEILDDNPNALWRHDILDQNRIMTEYPKNLDRVTVAVDPPSSDDPDDKSAEAGIMVGGAKGKKKDPSAQGYLIEDASIGRAGPEKWGRAAVDAYYKYQADKIVAEANNGGAMVRFTIQAIDPDIPVELVYASRGKVTRAEPVATLDERHRIHHCGNFPELEDQLCEWEPGMKSPDRLDARVWLFTDLLLGEFPLDRPFRSAVDEERRYPMTTTPRPQRPRPRR